MADASMFAAFHAIAFAAGAALSALLWHMQRRVDRAAGQASGYQLLWTVGFIWTFGNFLRYTLPLAGADATSVRLAGALAWSATILGPIAIARFLQANIGRTHRAARAFLIFAGAVSILNLGMLAWAAATHSFDVDRSEYPGTSLYLAIGVTTIALVLYLRFRKEVSHAGTATPRWFGRTVFVLAAIQVGAALLGLSGSAVPASAHFAAGLIGEHWLIPWSVLIAVSLAQIHFADLVLKRSLWLLASFSLSAIFSIFVIQVQPGLPLVSATLAGVLLMLATPSLIRGLDTFVDRAWLNRPDYVLAASQFEDSVRSLYDQDALFDRVASTVRTTLRIDARCVPASENRSSVRTLASIPLQAAIGASYRLEVSAGHEARTLMQQELSFLNTIGTLASRRLDAIHFEEEQRALHLREERLKRLLNEAELKALRTQVDPHFLFNTLNTIADLISTNPVQAERMTERLAECFRYVLSRHSRDLSTLDDEFEFARHYLDIEQVRFGERLRIQLSRGDARGDELVPSLLLQPLLENAIKHGVAPIREGGCISVLAKRHGEHLRLQVEDDGVGLRPDYSERRGVGLQNVKDRLQTLYSEAGQLVIGSRADGRGTAVTILVPLHGN